MQTIIDNLHALFDHFIINWFKQDDLPPFRVVRQYMIDRYRLLRGQDPIEFWPDEPEDDHEYYQEWLNECGPEDDQITW